jgi:diaminopimelate epimerase
VTSAPIKPKPSARSVAVHQPRTLRFTKMHGIGNDYIYVNAFENQVDDPAALAVKIADRHTGVGADGLILIAPPEPGVAADVRMRMFNADGSESEMCGNGVRCVCKYARDHGLSTANPMRVQTGRGVLSLAFTLDRDGRVDQVTVDMGEPILDLPKIPVEADRLARIDDHSFALDIGDERWIASFVSMGNPHAVFFDDENAQIGRDGLKNLELWRLGPKIENHPAFPRRINAHVVQVHSRREATMRTWERGSGITLACGTGACAVCAAGVLTGRFDRDVLLHLPGGDLRIRSDEKSNHVFMTGPATEIFSGDWPC